jgi:tetratricopeptide (TPR) repeat protein
MSGAIESAIRQDDWKGARRLIRMELRRTPDSHWLLTRLSLTFYEEFDYDQALVIGQQAFDLAPHCPLVLWDLAGTYDMLDRQTEASRIYRRLIKRGVEKIAFGDCGEGLAWARRLVTDCWYRLAHCLWKRGRKMQALHCYEQHLALRGPGCRSIYSLRAVRKELQKLKQTMHATTG